MIISIDGPAASGKSTTAKLIADKLHLTYLDTGAMYRAVALYSQKNNIDLDDFIAIESMLEKISIKFKNINNINHIFLNGEVVSEAIRTPEITKLSSSIATKKIIRQKMVEMQRMLAENQDVILDGRDIGTIVFPDADFKFYLTASLESRAVRRYKELLNKGVNANIEEIKQDLVWRDLNDSQREESPLKKAEDAIEVNTTEMTIDEQVNFILKVIKEDIA